jgi:Na+-driven multidrug efflux pump
MVSFIYFHLSFSSFLYRAGVAASTRVGNAIGRRDAAGAKFIGHLSALLSALLGAVVMLSMLLSKDVRLSL